MTIANRLCALAGTFGLVLLAGSAQADDTDIFYGSSSATPGAEPIVMFSLDWRPNLGSTADCSANKCKFLIDGGYLSATGPYTFFDILRASLRMVMAPLTGVRVGLMINHDNKNNCAGPTHVQSGCSNGGYIGLGARSFLAGDTNGAKAAFSNFLTAMPTPQGNASHPYQGKELFFELFRYLTGQGIYNGHVGYTDFASNQSLNMNVDTPAGVRWDSSIESGANYVSPLLSASECTKIFTVNIMFQVSQQEDDSDTALQATVASHGMNLAAHSTFPNVIKYLHDADLGNGTYGTVPAITGNQSVTSYFIVDPTKINTTTTGYAQAGGTGVPLPLASDPKQLVDELNNIFNQILSVSTTFVAASIPVNVFNRAEVVDNVFIALFQPNETLAPSWIGNVKKLKVAGLSTGSPSLVDALNQVAIAVDGRIRYDALTFWTNPATLLPADTSKSEVTGRDGRVVDRGGAGQQIPGYVSGSPGLINGAGTRQLFYDNGASLAAFNSNAATAAALQTSLGAATAAEAQTLIAWARGEDVDDLDTDLNVTEARRWIFGDPLHSRPLPLNYGARPGYSQTNPAIYLAVGSNDGWLRMLRNTTTGGAESGVEVWAFMPQVVMSKVSTLRTNASGVKHPYLVDDAPVAYLEDTNNNGTIDSGERASLFIGLRRGGKALYGLDVSNPDSPSLLWTITKGGNFTQLGYTFSTPRVILVPNGSGGTRPALIFAGGYDTNKDLRTGVGSNDSEGNAIFIVDAHTGALIWKAVQGSGAPTSTIFYHPDLVDSIPSSMAVMDSDGDGLHDRAYVGDTGGVIWRVDMAGSNTNQWKLTRLASLGRHAVSGKAGDRRFFHRPDIVQSSDSTGAFDAVVIGSGDREDPKDAGGLVSNYAYMIKDRHVVPGAGVDSSLAQANFGDITNTCLTATGACTADLTNGWRMALTASGEKSLATPLTISNTVYFTSYVPGGASSAGACGPSEGTGRLYAVALLNGHAINNYDTTTSTPDRYAELESRGIPAEVVSLPPTEILRPDLQIENTNATTRFRTYWYQEEDSSQ